MRLYSSGTGSLCTAIVSSNGVNNEPASGTKEATVLPVIWNFPLNLESTCSAVAKGVTNTTSNSDCTPLPQPLNRSCWVHPTRYYAGPLATLFLIRDSTFLLTQTGKLFLGNTATKQTVGMCIVPHLTQCFREVEQKHQPSDVDVENYSHSTKIQQSDGTDPEEAVDDDGQELTKRCEQSSDVESDYILCASLHNATDKASTNPSIRYVTGLCGVVGDISLLQVAQILR